MKNDAEVDTDSKAVIMRRPFGISGSAMGRKHDCRVPAHAQP